MDIPTLDAEQIFLQKRGVCGHYSLLFQKLCELADLRAEYVVGVATGYPESIVSGKTNHAWNAVKIGRGWYLFDVTWSSGELDAAYQFHRYTAAERDKAYRQYFCADPSGFVRSHLPDDFQWQLLDPPMAEKAFMKIAEQASDRR